MPTFAAVDIGSNSVRLSIAALRRGRLVVLHQDRDVTRLGEGVFRNGTLDPNAMALTVKVLQRFHKAVQHFGVERVRVVATSATRDCSNAGVFRDWVRSETGWKLEVISGLEEGRLIHLGVVSQMRTVPVRLLLIDLGGGSCELTLSEKGHIRSIITLPLGAVRLSQEFLKHDPPKHSELKRMEGYIAEEVLRIPRGIVSARPGLCIATSGTAAAIHGAAKALKLSGNEVTGRAVAEVAMRLADMTVSQRAAIKGINARRAEIIVAGSAVYADLMRACRIARFRYLPLGLRDGILAQMAAEAEPTAKSHKLVEVDRQDMLMETCRRYRVDTNNAEHVHELVQSLFDQTKVVHNLDKAFRDWLGAAAMLQECGQYINPAGRHRHAYYIIQQSELFGFAPHEKQVIATIARFQGKSKPTLTDRLVKLLPVPLREQSLKAIALLRVARALNQGRRRAVHKVNARVAGGEVVLTLSVGRAGADLELWAAEKQVPYFRETFGRELRFVVG